MGPDKFYAGDKAIFRRHSLNRGADAIRKMLHSEHDLTRTPGRSHQSAGIVPVVNGEAFANLSADFPIAILSGPAVTPSENETEFLQSPAFAVKVASENNKADHRKLAIVQGPLGASRGGYAVVSGVSICRVKLKAEGDGYAQPVIGNSDYLESCGDGPAKILWIAETGGTVERWAIVQLGGGGGSLVPYQLTEGFVYAGDTEPPTAKGRPLIADPDGGTGWFLDEETDPVDIRYTMAPTDADGNYLGLPVYGEGAWVWCVNVNGALEVVSSGPITATATLSDQWNYGAAGEMVWTGEATLSYYDYQGARQELTATVDIYNLTPLCYEDGEPAGVPIGMAGDQIKVQWSEDQLCWYVVDTPVSVYEVELDNELVARGEAEATVVVPDDADFVPPALRLLDRLMPEPEVGQDPQTIPAGTRLLVLWSEVHRKFIPIAEGCASEASP